ncbi:MAG: cache domain-containing protein [Halothiobacillaceae bacterium]|nr:cache domain-containing protein [Halothiobacillaceae bacterium]
MKQKMFIPAVLALFVSAPSLGDEYATAPQAEAMVAQVVKDIKENREATFTAITAKDAKYIQLDLYPVVYDMNGKCLSHGQNAKQVGKDLIGIADADGKEFIKERVELANSKGTFWQDYKFTDPVTKKILPKSAYCEKTADVIVCAGIYKR